MQFHGTIHFPIEALTLMAEWEPVRLDSADGLAVLIDLLASTVTSDDQWITSNFLSRAAPVE